MLYAGHSHRTIKKQKQYLNAHSNIKLLPDALLGMCHFQTQQKKRNHKGKLPTLRVRH